MAHIRYLFRPTPDREYGTAAHGTVNAELPALRGCISHLRHRCLILDGPQQRRQHTRGEHGVVVLDPHGQAAQQRHRRVPVRGAALLEIARQLFQRPWVRNRQGLPSLECVSKRRHAHARCVTDLARAALCRPRRPLAQQRTPRRLPNPLWTVGHAGAANSSSLAPQR